MRHQRIDPAAKQAAADWLQAMAEQARARHQAPVKRRSGTAQHRAERQARAAMQRHSKQALRRAARRSGR